MAIITELRDIQIPVLALVLMGGCATKLLRAVRVGSLDAGLGPTALFPTRLRRPVALAMCALECGLGIGLIVTAGAGGAGAPATCVRLGTALLFLVATCSLLELRASRPDLGCGCFGDFSGSPVDWRTLARSALLAMAALILLRLPPLSQPHSQLAAARMFGLLAVELIMLGALSPELSEALVRLGYSEPCELRVIAADRTLAALRRSKPWRRHAGLITADEPADVWRELCWRYLVFPGRCGGRDAAVVFAVYLRQRRPPVRVAVVDALTGTPLPWPVPPGGDPGWAAGPASPPGAPQAEPMVGSLAGAGPGSEAREG